MSTRDQRAVAARAALTRIISESDARPCEKRAMHAALDALWIVLVDDAPVFPSPLGNFRKDRT